MPSEGPADVKCEIGHVLFIDVLFDMRLAPIVSSAVALLILGGCAPLASVKQTRARFAPTDTEFSSAEKSLAHAGEIGEREPLVALCDDLRATRIAAKALSFNRNNSEALLLYNFAVARCVENVQRAHLAPWRRATTLHGDGETIVLTSPSPPDSEHDPSNYQLFPTDSLRLGGKFFTKPSKLNGAGAPLVAVGHNPNPQFRKRYELSRIYAGVTAVVTFRGEQARLDFVDPFSNERVRINDRSFPLAADFDTPLAMLLQKERPDKLGFVRLLRPEKYADTARLIRLQPFDPQRTPVILVHGLQDTPVSWVPMVNALRADPEIQRRYQFWVFSYPSGYPYPYSATLLRHELDGVTRAFPSRKRVILIGHSMGGMICRLMATDAGDKLWRNFFGASPAETKITGRTRELLSDVFLFSHRREVKQIIFISTPHRGAQLASNWIGRTATRFVKTPTFLADARDSVVSVIKDEDELKQLKRAPNSIDTLSPEDRFVIAVNKLPIASGIQYNSIIGDRGRGDTPNSSDGVVAYWSSHLDGAESELIVPTNHIAQRNPQTIAEVRRILRTAP